MLFTDSIKSMQTKHTVTSSDRKIWFGAYVWQILSIINKELRIEQEILLTTHAFWHMFGRGYERKKYFYGIIRCRDSVWCEIDVCPNWIRMMNVLEICDVTSN